MVSTFTELANEGLEILGKGKFIFTEHVQILYHYSLNNIG